MLKPRRIATAETQRGMALIVSLVILVAISLLGVAAMGGSRLEWLMANNSRIQIDTNLRIESALRQGEAAVRDLPLTFDWSAADAFYDAVADPLPADPRNPANWSSLITKNETVIGGTNPAKYVVEREKEGLGLNSPVWTFRIWAYSSDPGGGARIGQSAYALDKATSTFSRIAYAEITDANPPSP